MIGIFFLRLEIRPQYSKVSFIIKITKPVVGHIFVKKVGFILSSFPYINFFISYKFLELKSKFSADSLKKSPVFPLL